MSVKLEFDRRRQAVLKNFTIIQKTPHILHINDGTGSFVSLIRGSTRALLVDTSWGTSNLRELVENLVDTPYTVVNTHGHPDHCFGNCLFDEVLTPEKDKDVYDEIQQYSSNRRDFFKSKDEESYYSSLAFPPFTPLKEDTVFDLGDITVRTVPLYSHTHGSTGFLVEQERTLLAGDAAGSHVWLFMKESLNLPDCIKTYRHLLTLPFDNIIGSHAKVVWKKSILNTIIENIENTLSADYKFSDENSEEIMDYKTSAAFNSDEENSSWIVIRDVRYK